MFINYFESLTTGIENDVKDLLYDKLNEKEKSFLLLTYNRNSNYRLKVFIMN